MARLAALFCQFGHGHTRNVRSPHDVALGVALNQQLLHLRVAGGSLGRGRYQAGLVATDFLLVLGVVLAAAIAANLVAVAGGALMLRINHKHLHAFTIY